MSAAENKLNVVDEEGNIIGEDTRSNIHEKGLLHREVHVWFYTSEEKVLFQRRGKDKDTYPGLLDATVGGHVEMGMDYLDTAVQETEEETGIQVAPEDLSFLQMIRHKSHDPVTENYNNSLRAIYAYKYDAEKEKLEIEEGEGLGFEAWSCEKILNITDEDRKQFIPSLLSQNELEVFRKIKNLSGHS